MINMNIKRNKQAQFELFPGTAGSNRESGKKDRLIKDLTLSLENISVLCIISVAESRRNLFLMMDVMTFYNLLTKQSLYRFLNLFERIFASFFFENFPTHTIE